MNYSTAAPPLRFDCFELQPYERRLLRAGEPMALGTRAFDLLVTLAERAGQLVSKQTLMDLVWPDVVVEDNNLAAQISALRKVLGGDVIATIPGRGYRFTAQLDSVPPHRTANLPVATGPSDDVDAGAQIAPPQNVLTELPVLFGRENDIATLGSMVDQHRLVSIVGAGGMGKTLLAQHLLDARRDAYPHGVCWVELTPVADAAGVPGAIAAALGVHGGTGEAMDALIAAVAPLALLLALDNAEHLLADVAKLCQALRAAAPRIHIVVTSQAPLNVVDERVYRIGPLAVPTVPVPVAQALQFGAVALFNERAQAADARFKLTEVNVPAVIDVCRALDGLALAIELAAARAPMLGVQRLAASMHDRLKLLTLSRNRTAPARQQTLRAALEWSHSFLDGPEQAVFRRLAMMAGSASLELIQQVVADPQGEGALDGWGVLDALSVLVDRSLVSVLGVDNNCDDTLVAPPRYRLLDSPKTYALERLHAAGEVELIKRRHRLAIAKMFDAAWDEQFSGNIGHDQWMHQLSFDLDNAREAWTSAMESNDASSALAIGATLLSGLPQSLYSERRAVADCCETLIGPAVPERLRQRAWVQLSAHILKGQQRNRRHRAAQSSLELARSIYGNEHHPFLLYFALCRFASTAANVGDEAASAAAVVELEYLEDPRWAPQRLYFGADAAGFVAGHHSRSVDAVRYARRAVTLDRARGARFSWSLINLIDYELAAGDAAAAATHGLELVASLAGTRDEHGLTFARLNLTAARLALNECESARAVAQAGWLSAPLFDLQSYWADYLALLAALDGRPQAAARLMGYADAAYANLDYQRQPNEAAAVDRARDLVLEALSRGEYERLRDDGRGLHDDEIAALAFGIG